MVDIPVIEVLMQIPKEFVVKFINGEVYRQGSLLYYADSGKIAAHLKDAGTLDLTGILNEINGIAEAANSTAKAAALTSKVALGISAGTIIAVAIGVYALNKGMNGIKYQLSKAEKELSELKKAIDDIDDGIESQNDGDFTSALKNLQTAFEESATERIPGYRDVFIMIAERSLSRCKKIIEKGKATRLLETLKKYLVMYYVSMQCAIRCSISINQNQTAKKYVEDSLKQLAELMQSYKDYFKNCSGVVLSDCPLQIVAELPVLVKSVDLMCKCIEFNNSIISQLEGEQQPLEIERNQNVINLPYLNFENETQKIWQQV